MAQQPKRPRPLDVASPSESFRFKCPTRKVVLKASGEEIIITATDFDPNLHAEPGTEEATTEEGTQEDAPKKPRRRVVRPADDE